MFSHENAVFQAPDDCAISITNMIRHRETEYMTSLEVLPYLFGLAKPNSRWPIDWYWLFLIAGILFKFTWHHFQGIWSSDKLVLNFYFRKFRLWGKYYLPFWEEPENIILYLFTRPLSQLWFCRIQLCCTCLPFIFSAASLFEKQQPWIWWKLRALGYSEMPKWASYVSQAEVIIWSF